MNKTLQTILLTLVVSIGIGSRLSILGWLFIIGIGSSLIFGISHFIIHFYSMNYLSTNGKKNFIKIAFSHFFFLCIFLFQFDADDSRGYSVFENISGIENDFLNDFGFQIVGISIIAYIVIGLIIVKGAKKNKIKGENIKYILPAIITSIILPFLFINGLYANKDLLRTKELESKGEFNSVNRALKNPDNVRVLKINSYQTRFKNFPLDILKLPNVKVIELNEQNISHIPDDINKLESLEVLNLIDNELIEINPAICNCSKLTELRVGGEIKSIPDCLKTMNSLKHLSIQSKYSNELLDELRYFENIETAHFYLKSDVDFSSMTIEEGQEYNKNSKKFDKEKWELIKKETGIKHKY